MTREGQVDNEEHWSDLFRLRAQVALNLFSGREYGKRVLNPGRLQRLTDKEHIIGVVFDKDDLARLGIH